MRYASSSGPTPERYAARAQHTEVIAVALSRLVPPAQRFERTRVTH